MAMVKNVIIMYMRMYSPVLSPPGENPQPAMAAMDADTLAVELLSMVYELFEEGVPSQEEVRDWLLAPYRGGTAL